jgi:hypothetical protein
MQMRMVPSRSKSLSEHNAWKMAGVAGSTVAAEFSM